MSDPLDAARAALRARQGAGARYDAANAPAADLALARGATAYFARILNGIDDRALAAPVGGVTRAHVVAGVGLAARAQAEILASVRQGQAEGGRLPVHAAADPDAVVLGATLPPEALRNLIFHSTVHLDVEWRDLPDAAWDARVADAAGTEIVIRDLPRMRAVSLWTAALDLRAGARLADVPAELRAAVAGPRAQ